MSEEQAKQPQLLTRLKTRLAAITNAPRPEPMPEEPVLASFLGASDTPIEEYKIARQDYEAEVERRKTFHDDASKTIRRVFYWLLGTCLFCVLTLAGKPDAHLITAGAQVPLPILNYSIGFADFLVVGPLVLIGLTVYLHLFVAQHRMIAIPPKHRLAILPNFDAYAARVTIWFAYYWLVPATLVYFVWKAWPRAFEGWLVLVGSVAMVAVLAFLQIRRCPSGWRRPAVRILIASVFVYAVGLYASTNLRTLNLFKAELERQDLRNLNLSRADLNEAKLNGANLNRANLSGVDLRRGDLAGTDLSGANLNRANLSGANLTKADLSAGVLTKADLSRADLSGANLFFADLEGADLNGANLSGIDLRAVIGLSQAQLYGSCGDTETQLPEGFTIRECESDESEPRD